MLMKYFHVRLWDVDGNVSEEDFYHYNEKVLRHELESNPNVAAVLIS